jgi:tetratricopeptide (TPR) repeat protein
MADEGEKRLGRNSGWKAYRPLLWWGIVVGLVAVWQAHRSQLAKTTLVFQTTIEGHSSAGRLEVRLDGLKFRSGDRTGIGWKRLSFEGPEAEPFTTNVFLWYGANDLGRIDLQWKTGELSLVVTPIPQSVQLESERRFVRLSHVGSTNLVLPVGEYRVEAKHEHFTETGTFEVEAGTIKRATLVRPVGALVLATEAEFELASKQGPIVRLQGLAPQSFTNLPAGDYALRTWRGDYALNREITLPADGTETVAVRFAYGEVRFHSTPEQATVLNARGVKLGLTPLTVMNVIPGTHRFRLEYPDHDPEDVAVTVEGDAVGTVRVELRDRIYDEAMHRAEVLGTSRRYAEALVEVHTALGRKLNDPAALKRKTDLQVAQALDTARSHARRSEEAEAMQAVEQALELRPTDPDALRFRAELVQEARDRKDRQVAELIRQAEAARKNNDLAKAHDFFLRALEAAPTDAELLKQKEAVAEELTRRAEETRQKAVRTAFLAATANEPNAQWFDLHEWDLAGEPAAVRAALERLFTKQTTQWRFRTNQTLADDMMLYRGVQGGLTKGPFNRCVVVVGQTEAGRTRVAAKFWEYALPEIQDGINGADETRMTPIHPQRYKPQDPSRARTWLQDTYYEFERALKKELP